MTQDSGKKICSKCNSIMNKVNFYKSNNLAAYPDEGYVDECKKCFCMHVNNREPSTFIGLLKKLDVPFIEAEWNNLMKRYEAKNGGNPVGPTAILGRYLGKMKLEQFRNYRWEDGEKIAAARQIEREQQEMDIIERRKRREALIAESFKDQLSVDEIESLSDADLEALYGQQVKALEAENNNKVYKTDLPSDNPADALSTEDKVYLAMKWGNLYKPEEWIKLEKFYNAMMESFDIQSAAHIDYLEKICKTSLKMDAAIDCGDVEGFQKLARAYDSMMKSSKFTAAQNKSESGEFVDSVGELIYQYEKHNGFIEEYHTDEPKDIVDTTLKDFQNYTYRLVTEEMGLGDMIESALEKMLEMQEEDEGELDEFEEYLNPDEANVLEDLNSYMNLDAEDDDSEEEDGHGFEMPKTSTDEEYDF